MIHIKMRNEYSNNSFLILMGIDYLLIIIFCKDVVFPLLN